MSARSPNCSRRNSRNPSGESFDSRTASTPRTRDSRCAAARRTRRSGRRILLGDEGRRSCCRPRGRPRSGQTGSARARPGDSLVESDRARNDCDSRPARRFPRPCGCARERAAWGAAGFLGDVVLGMNPEVEVLVGDVGPSGVEAGREMLAGDDGEAHLLGSAALAVVRNRWTTRGERDRRGGTYACARCGSRARGIRRA